MTHNPRVQEFLAAGLISPVAEGLFDKLLDIPPEFADGSCTKPGAPEAFDPDDHEALKALCTLCPIKKKCLDIGQGTGSLFGTWGGERAEDLLGDDKE